MYTAQGRVKGTEEWRPITEQWKFYSVADTDKEQLELRVGFLAGFFSQNEYQIIHVTE